MNKQTMKTIGGVMTLIAFLVYIAQGAIRLNRVEENASRVPSMDKKLAILFLYVRLVDPVRFKQAEELAR